MNGIVNMCMHLLGKTGITNSGGLHLLEGSIKIRFVQYLVRRSVYVGFHAD